MDESVTGSANERPRVRKDLRAFVLEGTLALIDYDRRVHLRAPSVDKGVSSFLWALFFFLYLWLGSLAIGVSRGPGFIFSALAGLGIFFFVRILGEDRPRRTG